MLRARGSPPPVRVSQSGQYVAAGNGGLFNALDLSWSGALGAPIADARWFADGSLVTLLTTGNRHVVSCGD